MVWEQRWHPLRREWVVVSSHRNERPWHGERVGRGDAPRALPPYIQDCYLCPGNVRSSGQRNDHYSGVFVFDNDHPCVGPGAPMELAAPPGIYRNRPASGCARVVCFTPRHDLTLAQLPAAELMRLLEVLQAQYRDLGSRDDVRHVLVFENKGDVVGVSNPHPHCQIYATNFVFKTIELEAEAQAAHLAEHGRPLFQEILAAEQADGRRLVVRIWAEERDDEWCISVRDNGIGIPEKDRDRLFRRFERGSNTGGISGNGLGLHIIKEIAHGHGGCVSFDSTEGEGTTFVVHLPKVPVQAPHSPLTETALRADL